MQVRWLRGGRRLGATKPSVWVLTDDRPGNISQSIGLAEALAWPYEVKPFQFYRFARFLSRLPTRFLGMSRCGIRAAGSSTILSPWPDLVIATGRRLAPVARWIRKLSGGATRVVHLGRRGAHNPGHFDLVVSCAHFGLPPHPRRMEVAAPVNRVTPDRLEQAATRWPNLFGDASRPHILLLVGGTSSFCRLDEETARRLGEEVRAFAETAGGTVHALTSRRTGERATEALKRALGDSHLVHPWQAHRQDNPYLGYLATANILVVTGDSESMLAEAVATGKPVYIYALPDCFPGVWGKIRERLREWVVARASAGPATSRGTVRPQQGLEYLCAVSLARGVVLPPRNIRALYQTLFRLGLARPFGAELPTAACPALNEAARVARRVRSLMGVEAEEPLPAATKSVELGQATPDCTL
jgi:mitochondrial fission protein ELM1